MSTVHLHLLLNHVPVIGTVFVIALLVDAYVRRNSEIAKTALAAAAVLGAVAVSVYFTGNAAEEAVENLPGVSDGIIERHEDAALLATIAAASVAALAVGVLAWFRGRPVTRMATGASLAGALALAGLMAWTSNLGGQIRHTEIRGNDVGAATADQESGGGEKGEAHERESDR